MDVVRLFHDTQVDGFIQAFFVGLPDHDGLGICSQLWADGLENLKQVGHELRETVQNGSGREDEHPAVPKKIAALEEGFGHFQIWLFRKHLDLVKRFWGFPFDVLNVAVSGVGPCRANAKCHNDRLPACFVKAQCGVFEEIGGVADEIIAAHHEDACLRIALFDLKCGISDAGCGVSADRLKQYFRIPDPRQLRLDQVCVALVGHNKDVFSRDEIVKAFVSHLNHRFSDAHDVVELLGKAGTAHRPKPTADTAGHDNHIVMCAHTFYFHVVGIALQAPKADLGRKVQDSAIFSTFFTIIQRFWPNP